MKLTEFIVAWRDRAPETKGRCFYCGVQTHKGVKESHAVFHTKDHVIPDCVKLGDTDAARANRVCCCRRCNSLKEDLTLFEFKLRAEIPVFFAEELLGMRIDALEDIEEVTAKVIAERKIEGRSIKVNGKPLPRSREISALDVQSSLVPSDNTPASN